MAFFAIWGLIFFFLFVAGCVVVFVIGLVSESRRLIRLGGIPLAVLAGIQVCVMVYVALDQAVDRYHSQDTAWVFDKEFGFRPTRDITGLEGYATELKRQRGQEFPSRCVYMRFVAPRGVITAVRSDRFRSATMGEPADFRLRDQPAWWKPPEVPPGQLWVVRPRWPSGNIDRAVLYYDEESGSAYFAQECLGD
jgi:hypothetical protein